MSRMTGARFIAEALRGYGVTHVFFMMIGLVAGLSRQLRERT